MELRCQGTVRALSGHGRRQRLPWVLRTEEIQYREMFLPPLRSQTSRKEMLKPEKKHMKCLESREGDQCLGLQSKTLLLLLWPLSGGCCDGVGTAEEGDRDLGVGSKCCCCCWSDSKTWTRQQEGSTHPSPPIPGPFQAPAPLPDASKNPTSKGAEHCGLQSSCPCHRADHGRVGWSRETLGTNWHHPHLHIPLCLSLDFWSFPSPDYGQTMHSFL